MITMLTSREFNRAIARARRAAANGPVIVTDRGKPSLMLISYGEWLALSGTDRSIAGALADSVEVAESDVEFDADATVAVAADLD